MYFVRSRESLALGPGLRKNEKNKIETINKSEQVQKTETGSRPGKLEASPGHCASKSKKRHRVRPYVTQLPYSHFSEDEFVIGFM